jgi:ribosome-binding factor A
MRLLFRAGILSRSFYDEGDYGYKMANENRLQKINAELQREIYRVLTTLCNDGRISNLSIMSVACDREVRHAKVYIGIFSKDEEVRRGTFDAVRAAAGFVRRELSRIMNLRTVPELHFELDNSLEKAAKIDKILDEIAKQK